MTYVEITSEPPCEGRLRDLLDLAGRRIPAGDSAPIRRHVRSCGRCRGFLETLRVELDTLPELTFRRPYRARQTAPVPRSIRDFKTWIEEELHWRRQEELADLVARVGWALLRSDPEVKNCTAPAPGAELGASPTGMARTIPRQFNAKEMASLCPSRRSRASLSEVLSALQAELVTSQALREYCRSLFDHAHSFSGGHCAKALVGEAYLAWCFGDRERVPDLLSNAEQYATDSITRAAALSNQGSWFSDGGDLRRAIQAFLLASRHLPTFWVLHWNLFLLESVAGMTECANSRVLFLSNSAQLRKSNTLRSLDKQVKSLQAIYGPPPTRLRSIRASGCFILGIPHKSATALAKE